jgi:predicted transcriptional regulator
MTTLTIDLPDALAERLQRTFHPAEPAALLLQLLEEAIEREESRQSTVDPAFGLWQGHASPVDGLEHQQSLRAEWSA